VPDRIYLIRHARPLSAWNGGGDDPGLSALGCGEAMDAAGSLLSLAERPLSIVSSPMARCRETAEAFAARSGLPLVIDPRVGEVPTPAEVADRPAWLKGVLNARWSQIPPETGLHAWKAQVTAAALGHEGAAVFTHFVAINAIVSTLIGADRVVVFEPDFASITTLARDGGGWRLQQQGRRAATSVL
jgi:broad specificity phosphatase PhoE